MKNVLYKILVVVFVYTTIEAGGEEILPINLESALELGGANNLTIKEYKAKQELAAANLTKFKEWWLPDVFAGVKVFQLSGASMNSDGRFFLDVNANNLWSGMGIDARWNIAEGIYKTKAARLQTQASMYEIQSEKNQVLLAIIKSYYDLQTAQMKLIALKNLVSQSDTITRQIFLQVDAGLRYQSELLLAKSNHSHLKIEMLEAQSEYNRVSAELVRLLNLGSQVKLLSMDSVLIPVDFQEELLMVGDTVYQNRPEIKFIDFTIESLRMERKTFTAGLLIPQLSISVYGSYFGDLAGPVVPMFPSLYPETRQLYPTGMFNASLTWRIPFGHLVYRGDLQSYDSQIKIQEIKAEQFKARINEEIANARQRLIIGKEQIEIARESLELAAEALNQSMKRQELGTVRPFEVFQAQQFYLYAQIDYLRVVSEYNKAQFAFKVAKGEIL